MSDEWIGGANVGKLLEYEPQRYGIDAIEAFITETASNCFDDQTAGASEVDIDFRMLDRWTGELSITDNGKGMKNWEHVKEFHKLGSKSKTQTVGDIGFIGAGSHAYIRKAKAQYTETKNSSGFHARVMWYFDEDIENTRCKKQLPTEEIPTEHGTKITVHITDKEDLEKLQNDEYIKGIIYRYWNAVLLGFYGEKKIRVNGVELQPFSPDEEEHRIRTFKIGSDEYKSHLYKAKEKLPVEWQDIFIITGKKVITPVQDYFRVFPDEAIRNKLYGYILADGMIDIINSGKNGFNKRTTKYKQFEQKSAKEWKKFLEALGYGVVKQKDENSVKYTKKLDTLLNKSRWKKYKKLFEKTRQTPAKRKCPKCGTEDYHTWAKDERYYECENGHIFPKKYTWQRHGHTKVKTPTVKKSTSGVDVVVTPSPMEYLEAWVDGANKKIYINSAREPFKDAKKNKASKDIHWKRCIAKTMVDEMVKQSNIEEKEAQQEFFELYGAL